LVFVQALAGGQVGALFVHVWLMSGAGSLLRAVSTSRF